MSHSTSLAIVSGTVASDSLERMARSASEALGHPVAVISSLSGTPVVREAMLLVTLETFLTHHGSTTETADAMQLHRHTVGYRLSRVQEVSGLSPYESDGRERLSLGLKAAQILEAGERLSQPG